MKKLNKENLIFFAKNLYYTKNGNEYYLPLCSRVLAKKNGSVVGCAIGELYHEFIGNIWKYQNSPGACTSQAIERLAKKAKDDGNFPELFDSSTNLISTSLASTYSYGSFKERLRSTVTANDSIGGEAEADRILRAIKVQEYLMSAAQYLQ